MDNKENNFDFVSVIDNNDYLFGSQLFNALKDDKYSFLPLKIKKDIKGVYLVVFRMLKKDNNNVLVYNYIYYNPIFYNILISYLLSEKKKFNSF